MNERTEDELIAEVAGRVALENPDNEDLAVNALMLEKMAQISRRGGPRQGAGRPRTLPEGTILRTYRATPAEHQWLAQQLHERRQKGQEEK